jgi:hypothetical protein
VAVSGDTVVVGAYGDDSYRGSAYLFARNQGGADHWGQLIKLTASDRAADDAFAHSVAIWGDTVVVGAYADDGYRGSAYLFARNQGGPDHWGQIIKLTASDGAAYDRFGWSVAIWGDTVLVGAYGDDNSRGSAYLFARNQGGAGNWGQIIKLTASDGTADDLFGHSVAIWDDTVIVGALGDDYRGSAYLFARNQGGAEHWGQIKKLTASDGAALDQFGYSVAIWGDTVVVGADGDDIGSNAGQGSAYLFVRNQGGTNNWGQIIKLTASDGAADDWFGHSVAIWGNTVVVGAAYDDIGSSTGQGSAYVFGCGHAVYLPLALKTHPS